MFSYASRRVPFIVASILALACSAPSTEDLVDAGEPVEDELGAQVVDLGADQSDTTVDRAAIPLDVSQVTGLVDLRGVGDSGWANTHQGTPRAAAFGTALDAFDPSGTVLRGHLSYINWETVVGESCTQFASRYVPGKSYAFISRVENLRQAEAHGFNLVGLSNNHSRDCSVPSAEALTARNMPDALSAAALWAGIRADGKGSQDIKLGSFDVGEGLTAKVAFASAYIGSRRDCDMAVCASDLPELLKRLATSDADYRILSLHSMDGATQAELARVGADAVRTLKVDVVYGSGPHVWKPVQVVERNDGTKGVVFQSLGNFLHPSLAAQGKNYMGRALFSRDHALKQVQLVPIRNVADRASLSDVPGSVVPANLAWRAMPKGVFANVK